MQLNGKINTFNLYYQDFLMDSHERLEEYYADKLTDKYRGQVPLVVTADSVNSSFDSLNELRKTKKLPKRTKQEFVRNLEEEIRAKIEGLSEHVIASELTTLPDEPASMMAWNDEARYSARTGKILEFEPKYQKLHKLQEFFRSHAASMPGRKEKDYGWCAACGRPFKDHLGTREVEYNGKKRRIHNSEYDQFRDTGILRYVNRPRTEKDKSWLEKHWKPVAAAAVIGLAATAYGAMRIDIDKNPEKYTKMINSIENAKWLDGARDPILSVVKTLFPEPQAVSRRWYQEMIKELDEHKVTDPALRSYAIELARDDSFLDKDDLARSLALAEEYENFLYRLRDEYGGNVNPLTSESLEKMGYELYILKQKIERDPGIDDFIADKVLPYEFWGDPCIRDGDISEYDTNRHKFVWQNYKDSPFKENWMKPESRFFFMQSGMFRPSAEDHFDIGVKKGDLVPLTSNKDTIEREGPFFPVTVDELESYKTEAQVILDEALEKYPNNLSLAEAYTALNILDRGSTTKFLKLSSIGIINSFGMYTNLNIKIPKEKMIPGGEDYDSFPHLEPKYRQEFIDSPEKYFYKDKNWIYFESMGWKFSNMKDLEEFWKKFKEQVSWYEPSTLHGDTSSEPPYPSWLYVPAREEFVLK